MPLYLLLVDCFSPCDGSFLVGPGSVVKTAVSRSKGKVDFHQKIDVLVIYSLLFGKDLMHIPTVTQSTQFFKKQDSRCSNLYPAVQINPSVCFQSSPEIEIKSLQAISI